MPQAEYSANYDRIAGSCYVLLLLKQKLIEYANNSIVGADNNTCRYPAGNYRMIHFLVFAGELLRIL